MKFLCEVSGWVQALSILLTVSLKWSCISLLLSLFRFPCGDRLYSFITFAVRFVLRDLSGGVLSSASNGALQDRVHPAHFSRAFVY